MKKSKNIFILLFIFIIVATPNISKALPPGMSTSPEIFVDTGGGSLVDDQIEDKSSKNPIDNPSAYNPEYREDLTSDEDIEIVTKKASKIVSSITTVGIVASVVTMIILGIKYMMASVEEKAEYKKSMIPYLIGAIFLLSTSTVVSLIANLIDNINL